MLLKWVISVIYRVETENLKKKKKTLLRKPQITVASFSFSTTTYGILKARKGSRNSHSCIFLSVFIKYDHAGSSKTPLFDAETVTPKLTTKRSGQINPHYYYILPSHGANRITC